MLHVVVVSFVQFGEYVRVGVTRKSYDFLPKATFNDATLSGE